MAKSLGIVAVQTHRLASDYFNRFHNLMKAGRITNILKIIA
jgi:hypothetical protein